MQRRQLSHLALLAAAALAAPLALAQDKPAIRILVGFPPGGSVDIVARLLADKMRISLGQNVIVDNKPGAGGRIALGELRRAAADGQTLVLSPSGALVIQPWASQYVERGIAKVFADPDDYADPKPLTIAVNMVNTDWAAKNKDLMRRYYLAYSRGVRDYCQAYHGGKNRQDVIDIIVRTGLEERPEVLANTPWPARNVNGRMNIPVLLDMQKYYIKEGLASKEIGVDQLVNNEYVDAAMEKLGPFTLENAASKLEGCR